MYKRKMMLKIEKKKKHLINSHDGAGWNASVARTNQIQTVI